MTLSELRYLLPMLAVVGALYFVNPLMALFGLGYVAGAVHVILMAPRILRKVLDEARP